VLAQALEQLEEVPEQVGKKGAGPLEGPVLQLAQGVERAPQQALELVSELE
jgi:hypothetical protein